MSAEIARDRSALLAERLQSGIPLTERPYACLASELGCDEETVLTLANGLIRDGYVRSFGAFVDFGRLGYEGLLCGFIVPEEQLPRVVSRLDGREVTHNYIRAHRVNLWLTALLKRAEKHLFMDRARSCGVPFVALAAIKRLKLRPVFSFNPVCGLELSEPEPENFCCFSAGQDEEAPAVLSDTAAAALAALQNDFPVTQKPFEPAAQAIGINVAELLELLKELKAARVLRRIGVSLHHTRIGYSANALAAWLTEDASSGAASFPWVSHCYIRDVVENTLPFKWPYTLYTMLHAPDEASLAIRLKTMRDAISPQDSVVLPTVKELKKTRPVIKPFI